MFLKIVRELIIMCICNQIRMIAFLVNGDDVVDCKLDDKGDWLSSALCNIHALVELSNCWYGYEFKNEQ